MLHINKMKLFFLLILFCSISFSQSNREEKLQQLKSRADIKVTEIEQDIFKIVYPNGKVLYKNIGDYQPAVYDQQPTTKSPNYDSTIIDLRYIDTTLYHHKYSFWQEVPIHNWDFEYLRIGDVNNNKKPELYGCRKFFWTNAEPITVYELNESGIFEEIFQYDSVYKARNIYDIDNDGKEEVHLTLTPIFGIGTQQRFFSKGNDTSLATNLNFTLTYNDGAQLNDIILGNFDEDPYTDLLFSNSGFPDVHIFEYNHLINNFDSVYRFDISELPPEKGGFSVGDFDLDMKTDIIFGTMDGNLYALENVADNQYTNSWQGSVESNHAYIHTGTNDVDKNGKPEFWVLADAYYNGIGTTRITIFETNGDNSYWAVGRVDLVGIFSFYAGTIQAIDIDGDGTEEVAICIDQNFLILKFNGTEGYHTYQLYYIKKNELATSEEGSNYYGAIMYDLLNDGNIEILISMNHIIPQQSIYRHLSRIYKPDSLTSVIEDVLSPTQLGLYQNFPNPFNPSTNVKFELNKSENVSIKVYNILGKEITTLLDEQLSPGSYTIDWEAEDSNGKLLPSGVYFIKMKAGSFQKTIKTVLLK